MATDALCLDDVLSAPADFDVATVLLPGDPCVPGLGLETLRRIHRRKHQVAAAVRPDVILEVGVRAGYSAAAFLAARPRARYVGLDKDDGSHGGEVGYSARAARTLWGRYPLAWIEVYPWDSADMAVVRRLRAHRGRGFDLVHVDGDHTEAGCSSDLRLAAALARPGGWVLADDYDRIPEVRRAVDAFLAGPGRGWEALYLPSPTGEMLLRVPARGEAADGGGTGR